MGKGIENRYSWFFGGKLPAAKKFCTWLTNNIFLIRAVDGVNNNDNDDDDNNYDNDNNSNDNNYNNNCVKSIKLLHSARYFLKTGGFSADKKIPCFKRTQNLNTMLINALRTW
jgi:hypothetical protein